MKNIVLPLLLANSSKTEAQKTKGMAGDYAVPAPILIADAWTTGECTDTAVTAASTELATAKSAWQTLVDEKKKTFDAAVTTAVDAKKAAVDAVIAKDAAIATKIAADDTEQQKELTFKKALDDATYAKATSTAAAAAAATAKTAADTAKTNAEAVQTAMNTASTSAGTHYTAEQAETASLTTKRNAAETDYNAKNAAIANFTTLYNTAKGLYDTKKAEWDTKTQEKADFASKLTKMTTALTAATTDVDAASAGSAAHTKAAAQTTLDGLKTTYDTAAAAWVVKGKLTVAAMKAWVAAEAWSNLSATNKCKTATEVALTTGNANAALCKTKCAEKKAWGMNAGNTFPTGASYPTGADYCTGIAWGGTTCLQYHSAAVVAGDSDVTKSCEKRSKVALATPLINADALTKSGAALETAWGTALTNWTTSAKLMYAKDAILGIATAYKTKITTSKNAAGTASTGADTAYNTVNGALTPLNSDMTTKKGNLDTGTSAKDTAKALWDSLKAQVTAQTAEEAAQLAIKTLAEGDLTAQNTAVTAAGTAATAAATAKTTADTDATTKGTAFTTATTNYNNQVTAAAATAAALTTPLSELATLRTTAGTATTALATAITNQTGQQKLITDAQVVVNTATAKHLAAVVACKEAAYDKYSATLATAEADRATKLKAIEKLIADTKAAMPAKGAAGSRCEKAMSNGTWRPKRDAKTCADGLCCGAAKIAVGKATMIIETCQTKTDTAYSYVAPRAPMATVATTAVSAPFMCITGAQKLVAAASAAAAALYMMA